MDDFGFSRIVDRKKDMILSPASTSIRTKSRMLSRCTRACWKAAVGVPDVKSGEAVKIFVVKKDPNLTPEAIIAHCRDNLTGYKVPSHVEFRSELPKTNVGKILRRALGDGAAA